MNIFDLPPDHWLHLAHKKSIRHRLELQKSDLCGCFHCLKTFAPEQINQWTDGPEIENETALCPFCGIDSVIGEASGFELTPEFLNGMQKAWFRSTDD